MDRFKKLLIVSDINGFPDQNYFNCEEFSDVDVFSSLDLSEMPDSNILKEDRHTYFLNKGIDKAVDKLAQKIRNYSYDLAMGFSIGGLIVWKYLLEKNNIEKLICFSTTRLRFETSKPKSDLNLIYGSEDFFIPDDKWFADLNIGPLILKDENHEFYMDKNKVKSCLQLLNTY